MSKVKVELMVSRWNMGFPPAERDYTIKRIVGTVSITSAHDRIGQPEREVTAGDVLTYAEALHVGMYAELTITAEQAKN